MQRLIRRGADMTDEEISERARIARAEIANLTRLVATTLEAMRLDDGQTTPKPHPCDPVNLVQRVADRQRIAMPGREIIVSVCQSVPKEVEIDPFLVEQILSNLLSNADKYSPSREPIELGLALRDNALEVAVSDYGIGIPEIEQEGLFSRFYRASTASGTQGFGVGLSVCAQLAKLKGGMLVCESRHGIGSTFMLFLPVVGDEAPHFPRSNATAQPVRV